MQRAKSLGFLIQTAYQRTVPAPLQKKAYRISVPYFLAKIEAYRTKVLYRTAILDCQAWIYNAQGLRHFGDF